jgi:hypothetical protein
MDLERRRWVDVLPHRSAATFARRLMEYSGVEIVSRDRGGAYDEAARRTALSVVQVADYFHLLTNLRDVISRVFRQHDKAWTSFRAQGSSYGDSRISAWIARPQKSARGSTDEEFFESMHTLSKKGMKNAQVFRELGIHRHSVEKTCLAFNAACETSPREKGQRPGALRGLNPQAVGAGLSQRHSILAVDLRAGLPLCLSERRSDHRATSRNRSACQDPYRTVH